MDKTLLDICLQQHATQFEVLRSYFKTDPPLTLAFLAGGELDEADLLDLIPPSESTGAKRLVMKLFFRKVLLPLLEQGGDPFEECELEETVTTDAKFLTGDQLNLARRMVPIEFKKFQTHNISADALNDHFKDEDLSKVRLVNFAQNQLLDADMGDLLSFVENKLPSCEIVDLSWNRFHGILNSDLVDQPLSHLLSLDKIRFVDITYNALASVDRITLFHALFSKRNARDEPLLSHLIWVPQNWLVAGGWKRVVPNEAIETVLTAHRDYYDHGCSLKTLLASR